MLALVDAYKVFLDSADKFVHITNKEDYTAALVELESALTLSEDTVEDSLNPLIELLSQAIERYESNNQVLSDFINEVDDLPSDIVMLRTLMSQYELTGSDFPEIGGKAMESKVLNGTRVLSRQAIEQLSFRFGLRPAMFF